MKFLATCRILLAFLFVFAPFVQAEEAVRSGGSRPAAAAAGERKVVRLLVIGNSFSTDATHFLDELAEAGGHTLVFGHAFIPSSPMEWHLRDAMAHEKDPADPAGKPYVGKGGAGEKVSLKGMLQAEAWEYVTIQQASMKSFEVENFRPVAQQMVDYIRRYAPRAQIVLHETWAYRADNPMFSEGKVTRQGMYDGLHAAYRTIASEIGAAGIIPVGTAFENALKDPRWVFRVPENVDRKAYAFPDVPKQENSLHVGYKWAAPSTQPESQPVSQLAKKSETQPTTKPGEIVYDGSHASVAGRYLGACTWYEFFIADVRGNAFAPKGVTPEQAATLQDVAHGTVRVKAPTPLELAVPSR